MKNYIIIHRNLQIEIYKTITNLNPGFMKNYSSKFAKLTEHRENNTS